ncbi:hypothetical protein BBK36DRAFT_1172730 [Trichoderma citrinoviride]|uniref:Uncharacterized protein n=1 Tax=Trichoderma citrinoviride TaxID=58853 RepID=A0A2T4AYX6_9HYPO|nr:hypothetical protein BBK36DRAFT_1172730 [Trichoderma citrinoviride]PTB62171.1 hypothetical protein BBK36DRAFT_1172730 [Trichoderma citrinoviride]
MPSTNRLRRHKRKNASGGAKSVVERQPVQIDNTEEPHLFDLPDSLTVVDLKSQRTMKQAWNSVSTRISRDARTSGDHRKVEHLAATETKRQNKDAPEPKGNEIKKGASQGNLMAEDGPWNSVLLSSDEERSGWTKINRDDCEAEQHAVTNARLVLHVRTDERKMPR